MQMRIAPFKPDQPSIHQSAGQRRGYISGARQPRFAKPGLGNDTDIAQRRALCQMRLQRRPLGAPPDKRPGVLNLFTTLAVGTWTATGRSWPYSVICAISSALIPDDNDCSVAPSVTTGARY